jgi:Rrf2 family protein
MLALTRKTGYALIALTHLAELDAGELSPAREIADRYDAPRALMMNVLKDLAGEGYVESVRGARGGYRLARPLDEVTLADLVSAIEGPVQLAECVGHTAERKDKGTCRIRRTCPIVDPIYRVHRRLREFLGRITLAEIVNPAMAPTGP